MVLWDGRFQDSVGKHLQSVLENTGRGVAAPVFEQSGVD